MSMRTEILKNIGEINEAKRTNLDLQENLKKVNKYINKRPDYPGDIRKDAKGLPSAKEISAADAQWDNLVREAKLENLDERVRTLRDEDDKERNALRNTLRNLLKKFDKAEKNLREAIVKFEKEKREKEVSDINKAGEEKKQKKVSDSQKQTMKDMVRQDAKAKSEKEQFRKELKQGFKSKGKEFKDRVKKLVSKGEK